MKALFLLVALGLPAAAGEPPSPYRVAPAHPTRRKHLSPTEDLNSGHYTIKLGGMLCRVCEKVIADEVTKIREVEKVRVDFGTESLDVGVKVGKILKMSALKKALRRASERINLDTQYSVVEVRYKVR